MEQATLTIGEVAARTGGPHRRCASTSGRPDRGRAHRRQPAPLPAIDAAADRLHPGRTAAGIPLAQVERRWPRCPAEIAKPRRLGAAVTTLAGRPGRANRDADRAARPADHLHRLRLSVARPCALLNPGDEAAGTLGAGAHGTCCGTALDAGSPPRSHAGARRRMTPTPPHRRRPSAGVMNHTSHRRTSARALLVAVASNAVPVGQAITGDIGFAVRLVEREPCRC